MNFLILLKILFCFWCHCYIIIRSVNNNCGHIIETKYRILNKIYYRYNWHTQKFIVDKLENSWLYLLLLLSCVYLCMRAVLTKKNKSRPNPHNSEESFTWTFLLWILIANQNQIHNKNEQESTNRNRNRFLIWKKNKK